jgi:hypothetical protein
MRPPALAAALIAAAAPSSDYEAVAGDLHEEYLRIMNSTGEKAADRWYWAQTLLSMPSLLSYSRSHRSGLRLTGVAFTAIAVLFAMLVVIAVIDTLFNRIPIYASVCIYNADALLFGAILAWLVRTDTLRVTFCASIFLVLCFAIPAFAGHPGSQAPFVAWIQLFAAVPVMCIGAASYQVIRHRADSSN